MKFNYIFVCDIFIKAAERVLERAVGRVDRWFISNAPLGHYMYSYPKELQEQRKAFGAKVFFYRSQFIKGTVKLNTKLYKDFAWVARYTYGILTRHLFYYKE